MNVVVVGSGSWGTALAIKSVLAGNTTTLYCRRPEFADQLAKDLENKEYVISLFYLVQTMRKKLDEIYRLHLF